MNEMEALENFVEAGKKAKHLDKNLRALGYGENPYWEIFGAIADGIYHLIGEKTEMFEDSVTHRIFDNEFLNPHESAVELLKGKRSSWDVKQIVCKDVYDILADEAKKRDIDPNRMARVIISEWALGHLLK